MANKYGDMPSTVNPHPYTGSIRVSVKAPTGKASAPGQLFKQQGLPNASSIAPGRVNQPSPPTGNSGS
jgi:hypothetical protein